ncbi:6-phosphogluconate dehydrogenase [Nibricoccus aquaticus]|uniref:6-phosphogluconate dehydrogenase n=1 Tax=Nibricoccus aquaticus TaxID=2576891 RepID=A0A290QKL2_9BACT|nr:NAD(P)-dependent oxidoreductase [Nibricoccus aquaticus]ATC65888.1 6-phosphogluconate dehydrogenase [Nibricoccus aquaticus]
MKTIGVIGLGIIGGVWAKNYEAAGVLAGVWNRTAQPEFPKWKREAREVASAADVVQIVVADPPAVQSVLDAILPALGPGKIVVQSSTIDGESSDGFLKQVTAKGARYLEAPFTGSKPAAEQKKTIFFLGGDAALVAELEPLLALVSETRFHIGTHRQATAIKLAMNLNIAVQMQGLGEALTFARRAGVSDETFFTVIKKNVSNSGLVALKEPKLRAEDFSPQFSVKHMLKDMRLASRTTGCEEMPMLDTIRGCLHATAQAGYADEDFSALIRLLGPQER